jgi:hypothetical protein
MTRITAACITLAVLLAAPCAAQADGLSGYVSDPDYLRAVKPGSKARIPARLCPSPHMTVDAFTGTGLSMRVSLRPGGRDGFVWTHTAGGYVVFDAASRTFRNGTRRTVLATAWCARVDPVGAV